MSEQNDKPKKDKFVTRQDFDRLAGSVEALASSVTTFIENQVKPQEEAKVTDEEKPAIVKAEEPDKMPVPPEWRKLVDETLGEDFGINIVYPSKGAGFQFKIIVPLDKSNAGADYLEFYKVDIRTKSISYSEGIEGVKKYCELVAKNLGIKKQNA